MQLGGRATIANVLRRARLSASGEHIAQARALLAVLFPRDALRQEGAEMDPAAGTWALDLVERCAGQLPLMVLASRQDRWLPVACLKAGLSLMSNQLL